MSKEYISAICQQETGNEPMPVLREEGDFTSQDLFHVQGYGAFYNDGNKSVHEELKGIGGQIVEGTEVALVEGGNLALKGAKVVGKGLFFLATGVLFVGGHILTGGKGNNQEKNE